MNKGTVEQMGTPAEVYGRPRSTYVASFVGTPGLNLLRGTVEPAAGIVRLAEVQYFVYDRTHWPEVRPGAIQAGFLAEAVKITPDKSGLQVDYQLNEELGSSRLLHCAVPFEAVVALSASLDTVMRGQQMALSIAPDWVHLFDADTDLRLKDEQLLRPAHVEPPMLMAVA